MVRREVKKGALKIDLITKYNPVGIVDDFLDPKENNNTKYSIAGRARNLSI